MALPELPPQVWERVCLSLDLAADRARLCMAVAGVCTKLRLQACRLLWHMQRYHDNRHDMVSGGPRWICLSC